MDACAFSPPPSPTYPEGRSSSNGEGVRVLVSRGVTAEVRVHLVRALGGEGRVIVAELAEEID